MGHIDLLYFPYPLRMYQYETFLAVDKGVDNFLLKGNNS